MLNQKCSPGKVHPKIFSVNFDTGRQSTRNQSSSLHNLDLRLMSKKESYDRFCLSTVFLGREFVMLAYDSARYWMVVIDFSLVNRF